MKLYLKQLLTHHPLREKILILINPPNNRSIYFDISMGKAFKIIV